MSNELAIKVLEAIYSNPNKVANYYVISSACLGADKALLWKAIHFLIKTKSIEQAFHDKIYDDSTIFKITETGENIILNRDFGTLNVEIKQDGVEMKKQNIFNINSPVNVLNVDSSHTTIKTEINTSDNINSIIEELKIIRKRIEDSQQTSTSEEEISVIKDIIANAQENPGIIDRLKPFASSLLRYTRNIGTPLLVDYLKKQIGL